MAFYHAEKVLKYPNRPRQYSSGKQIGRSQQELDIESIAWRESIYRILLSILADKHRY